MRFFSRRTSPSGTPSIEPVQVPVSNMYQGIIEDALYMSEENRAFVYQSVQAWNDLSPAERDLPRVL